MKAVFINHISKVNPHARAHTNGYCQFIFRKKACFTKNQASFVFPDGPETRKPKCVTWRKVGPAKRVTLPSKKDDPARQVLLFFISHENGSPSLVRKCRNRCLTTRPDPRERRKSSLRVTGLGECSRFTRDKFSLTYGTFKRQNQGGGIEKRANCELEGTLQIHGSTKSFLLSPGFLNRRTLQFVKSTDNLQGLFTWRKEDPCTRKILYSVFTQRAVFVPRAGNVLVLGSTQLTGQLRHTGRHILVLGRSQHHDKCLLYPQKDSSAREILAPCKLPSQVRSQYQEETRQ